MLFINIFHGYHITFYAGDSLLSQYLYIYYLLSNDTFAQSVDNLEYLSHFDDLKLIVIIIFITYMRIPKHMNLRNVFILLSLITYCI